jgi:hypothetical protein
MIIRARRGMVIVTPPNGDAVAVRADTIAIVIDKRGEYCDMVSTHGYRWRVTPADMGARDIGDLTDRLVSLVGRWF